MALAVLDFHFLTGDPMHPNALLLLRVAATRGCGHCLHPSVTGGQHLVTCNLSGQVGVVAKPFRQKQFDIDTVETVLSGTAHRV